MILPQNQFLTMSNSSEPEGVDELQDVKDIEGDDSTDWKSEHQKLVEKAIKARERNKMLRENFKKLETELEGYRKPKPEAKPQDKNEPKPDEALLQRMERIAFKQHEVSHEDDRELARRTAKKWNMEIEDVLEDEDFQTKLKKQQDSRANVEATSKVKGGAGGSSAKNTPEYWLAQGRPPTPEEVPDNATRRKITGAMWKKEHGGGNKKFYND